MRIIASNLIQTHHPGGSIHCSTGDDHAVTWHLSAVASFRASKKACLQGWPRVSADCGRGRAWSGRSHFGASAVSTGACVCGSGCSPLYLHWCTGGGGLIPHLTAAVGLLDAQAPGPTGFCKLLPLRAPALTPCSLKPFLECCSMWHRGQLGLRQGSAAQHHGWHSVQTHSAPPAPNTQQQDAIRASGGNPLAGAGGSSMRFSLSPRVSPGGDSGLPLQPLIPAQWRFASSVVLLRWQLHTAAELGSAASQQP